MYPKNLLTKTFILINLLFLGNCKKLGLIYKTQELSLAKGEDKRQVEILLPVANSLKEYQEEFKILESHFTKIRDIPGLAQTSVHYDTVSTTLTQIDSDLRVLILSLEVLSSYRDTKNEGNFIGKCEVTWKRYTVSYLEEISSQLQTLTKDISTTSDETYFSTNPAKLSEIKLTLDKMSQVIGQVSKEVLERVKIMDLVANKQLDSEVLFGIQQKTCVLKSELENTEILSCKKTKEGLLCVLEITALTNQKRMDVYSLINYEGVQLKFTEGNYLVKQDSTWFGLTCEKDLNEKLDSFDLCKQVEIESDCVEALGRETIDPYLEKCNFEKTEPVLSQITMEGVLVQGTDLTINLLDSLTDYRPDKISKAPPLLFKTNKIVRILKDEFEKTIHPNTQVTTEEIIESWLSEDDIASLQSKIKIKEILSFDHYESIVGAVLISLIALIMGFIFKKQRTLSKQVENDVEKQVKKFKTKQNLKENKNVRF
jgi:hypothetical protein